MAVPPETDSVPAKFVPLGSITTPLDKILPERVGCETKRMDCAVLRSVPLLKVIVAPVLGAIKEENERVPAAAPALE